MTVMPEHNWVVEFKGWKFGIVETDWSEFFSPAEPTHSTIIFLGSESASLSTNLPAYAVLAIGVVGLVAIVSAVTFIISRASRKVES